MTAPLFEKLANDVTDWRQSGYPCKEYPLIGEVLSWQQENREDELPFLKFLRDPQFLALEIYWYVRLVLGTPHVMDLYKKYYGDDKAAFFNALGVSMSADALEYVGIDDAVQRIKEDEGFVREKKIQALHEAVRLEYPSYILALAMGAGKTVLIGAIIATEFAMSLRHPKDNFMKNALVFAPGTTIIESLRELSEIPFEKILPPDLNRDFLANLKIEYPGKGKDIQAQQGSSYNLIVTNTEKISLRANRRKNQQQEAFEREELQANLRLQKIAGLPKLGIFSDEAHHTYGNVFENLKRVRKTIDWIHDETPIVAVINTTGTPYYKSQQLKDVIVWYGLGEGIEDNILKNLNNGIHQYDIGNQSEEVVFGNIIEEFFTNYGKVTLPSGAKAKIAFYFKTQEHLEISRVFIEQAMAGISEAVSQILVNTQKSNDTEIAEFNRLNNPDNQKRVILLIGKGVEGWNCPSLFACALIKEQTKRNNYVLQAATRCLRQVSGNQHSAKIFLDAKNAIILDKELQDNFGTDLGRITMPEQKKTEVILRIRKQEPPKLEITRTIKSVVRTKSPNGKITLQKPKAQKPTGILRNILTPDFDGPREILMPTGEAVELPAAKDTTDCHTAAWKIASRYHLPAMPILKKIKEIYPKGEMPNNHLQGLFQQVEKQQADYEIIEETVKEVLALIKIKDENGNNVFEEVEDEVFVHRLRLLKRTYDRMMEQGLFAESAEYQDKWGLSFHYEPYNFDSKPERSAFQKVLAMLNTKPEDIEAFLFTGGLTDPSKTDFHFEYLGEDNRYHRYFPDFVIVKKTGEFYIIEVKASNARLDETVKAKQKSVEQIQNLQSEQFKYQVVYTPTASIEVKDVSQIKQWVGS